MLRSLPTSDVKLIDLTDDAIYVWMSDQMIMPVPIHAFRNESEMEKCITG